MLHNQTLIISLLLLLLLLLHEGDRGTSVIELVVTSQLAAMRDDGTYDTIYNNAVAAGNNKT